MSRISSVFVVVVLVSLLGCGEDVPKGDALAVVNDAVLTIQEFNSEIPLEYVMGLSPDQKMGFVERWINTELVYQEALRQGLDKDDRIAARLSQVRKELLANELLQREMAGKVNVSDDEVSQYFEAHRSEYNTEIKIAHILLSSPDTAATLLSRLKEGADFAELAKQYSLDPSGQAGGISDYIKRGDMAQAPELEEAAFALERPGELSDVVQSEYGYHIVRLVARRPLSQAVEFADVSDRIRDALLMQKQKEVFESLIAGLRSKAELEVHPELLAPFSPAPAEKPEGS